MSHLARRVTIIFATLLLTVFSVNLSSAATAYATQTDNANNNQNNSQPTGKNGTLKIHEYDTPDKTESNDPKVCTFNFEGFNFDENQDSYVVVTPKGGDSDTSDTVTIPFGPTDGDGYTKTAYINDGASGYDLDNGHYKATLHGKDTGNQSGQNLNDKKTKSKVFKVECNESPDEATPKNPTIKVQTTECVPTQDITGSVIVTVTNTKDDTGAAETYSVTVNNQTQTIPQSCRWRLSQHDFYQPPCRHISSRGDECR